MGRRLAQPPSNAKPNAKAGTKIPKTCPEARRTCHHGLKPVRVGIRESGGGRRMALLYSTFPSIQRCGPHRVCQIGSAQRQAAESLIPLGKGPFSAFSGSVEIAGTSLDSPVVSRPLKMCLARCAILRIQLRTETNSIQEITPIHLRNPTPPIALDLIVPITRQLVRRPS